MTDISSKNHIQQLVELFYGKALKDELLAPIFNSSTHFQLETHIPVIVNYWNTMLFQSNTYQGDMMGTHFQLNENTPLQPKHFKRWVELFVETANQNFEGPKTTEITTRANTIAQLMSFKLNGAI